jgi:hypothetical protein
MARLAISSADGPQPDRFLEVAASTAPNDTWMGST